MNQAEILAAIDAAPDGKLPEGDVLGGKSYKEALRLTNLTSALYRQGLIRRLKENGNRFYVRWDGQPVPVQGGE